MINQWDIFSFVISYSFFPIIITIGKVLFVIVSYDPHLASLPLSTYCSESIL